MAYTDKTAVKAYLGIVTTDDDALLDVLIPRAQAIIDAKTGRTFEAASDSVRYFSDCDVSGATLYLDHDLCAITSIHAIASRGIRLSLQMDFGQQHLTLQSRDDGRTCNRQTQAFSTLPFGSRHGYTGKKTTIPIWSALP